MSAGGRKTAVPWPSREPRARRRSHPDVSRLNFGSPGRYAAGLRQGSDCGPLPGPASARPGGRQTLPLRSPQVRYISLHSSSIRHILLDISETLTPPYPRYPCAIHSMTDDTARPTVAPHRARSHRRAASGKTPPPRRIGQDATAAPHRARRHRRTAAGLAAMQRGPGRCYTESSSRTRQGPGVYKPPAVPSGAAQGAHYPAGTRGDIQAVTTHRPIVETKS